MLPAVVIFLSGLPGLTSCREGTREGKYLDERIFTVEELNKDFNQAVTALREHPRLYRFTSQHELERLIRKQETLINRELTVGEFYCILAPVVTGIGCCHTAVSMPEGFWTDYKEALFPVRMKFLPQGVFACGSYTGGESLPAGSQVLGINGMSVDSLLAGLNPLISADAFNQGHIRYRLEQRFSLLFALKYGPCEQFVVEYLEPPGFPGRNGSDQENPRQPDHSTLLVDATGPDPVLSAFHPEDDLLFLVNEDSSIAVMTIKTFAYYGETQKFTAYLDDCFAEIKRLGITSLIIDLRGNDGGDPFCAVPLLSYLANNPVPYFARPFGRYARFAEPVELKENRYTGELYTLIDGGNVSTSGHFCSLLKYHGIGNLVGSETGATYTCNDASRTTVLKHTGLQVNVPRITFAAAVANFPDDRGILPDYPVETSPADLAEGRDGVLEYTMGLFK